MTEIDKGKKYVTTYNHATNREKWSSIVYEVMDVLNLAEIPEKHIVKCWKKDAGDILPRHLVHYQKNGAVNHSFTCRHSTVTYKRLILLE